MNGEDVEPVIKVLTEGFFLNRLQQVAVGRGDDADIDADRGMAADAVKFMRLQNMKELGLHLGRKLADLVEENGAAVGQLEAADALGDGAGEGPFLVAEKLALHQARRQGAAIDLDERLAGAPARGMDGPREELLPRAGLAGDEHGSVGRCHSPHVVEYRTQRRAVADDRVEVVGGLDLVLEIEVLLVQPRSFSLGEDTVGDIHPDGAARLDPLVGASDGLHPQADPERPAVAAMQCQFQPREFLAALKSVPQEGRLCRGGRRWGEKIEDRTTVHLVRRVTDHLRGPVIGAQDSPFAAHRQIAHRRLVVEIAIPTFALRQPFLGPQPFQLRSGPSGEDPENEQPPRLRRHRPLVKHGQMTEDLALAVQERDAHVAVDAQAHQRGRVREVLRHTCRVMDESPARDGVARRGRKVIFHVVDDPITRRKGDGAHPRIHVGELGDDGIGHIDGRSQSADQRPEKLLSRTSGRPFDDIA